MFLWTSKNFRISKTESFQKQNSKSRIFKKQECWKSETIRKFVINVSQISRQNSCLPRPQTFCLTFPIVSINNRKHMTTHHRHICDLVEGFMRMLLHLKLNLHWKVKPTQHISSYLLLEISLILVEFSTSGISQQIGFEPGLHGQRANDVLTEL